MATNNQNQWVKVVEKDFDELPTCSAVYVITAKTNKGVRVIYTGQTDDIHRRANEHWSDSEPNKKLKNVIKKYRSCISLFYVNVNKQYLDGYERYLYNYFDPQAQDRAPDVQPVKIELSNEFSKGKINETCFS